MITHTRKFSLEQMNVLLFIQIILLHIYYGAADKSNWRRFKYIDWHTTLQESQNNEIVA